MRKDLNGSSLSVRKYRPCSRLYIRDGSCEKGLTLGLFSFCRLVFAKLKLLMIAIEYKSEKRESRYVQCLQMLKFRNALSRILPAFFFSRINIAAIIFFETFQSIISTPSHYTISHSAERLLFLFYSSSLKLI